MSARSQIQLLGLHKTPEPTAPSAARLIRTVLQSAPASCDLLLVDRRAGHSPVSRVELGSIAAELAAECRQSILIFERALSLEKPVSVLVDAEATTPFTIALDLARTSGHLQILVDATDDVKFQRQSQRWQHHGVDHGIIVQTEWIRVPSVDMLSSYLHSRGSGMLVIGAAAPVLQREGVTRLWEALRVPLLLAR